MRSATTRDFAEYSRCHGLDGLEVMSARWVEHSFAPHMHDCYAVSLNDRGRGAFDCRREAHDATPGTCKEWLDANFEQNVSIRSLADLAGLSPYYLVRAFHRQVGVPPHRYQTIVRVHRARKLLTSGAALSEVAYRTGFCDQSHLTRCFKRTLSVTPGSYTTCHAEWPLG
jgi:transcriptional regulator GlxA family with amidase domain